MAHQTRDITSSKVSNQSLAGRGLGLSRRSPLHRDARVTPVRITNPIGTSRPHRACMTGTPIRRSSQPQPLSPVPCSEGVRDQSACQSAERECGCRKVTHRITAPNAENPTRLVIRRDLSRRRAPPTPTRSRGRYSVWSAATTRGASARDAPPRRLHPRPPCPHGLVYWP